MKSEFRRYDPSRPGEAEALLRLHQETEAAIGRKMDFPKLDEHPVLVAEVLERNGELLGGLYLESTPEVCFIGRSAEVTVSAVRHAPEVFRKLKECGFRFVRVQVPRSLSEEDRTMIREQLEAIGFQENSAYEHYFVDLR